MQTVKAFDSEDGMRKFRDWVMNPDEAELLAAVRPQKKRKRKKQAKPGEHADQGLTSPIREVTSADHCSKFFFAIPCVLLLLT